MEGTVISYTSGEWGTVRCNNGEEFHFHATNLWSIGGLTAPGDFIHFSKLHNSTMIHELKRHYYDNVYTLVYAGLCGRKSGFRVYVMPEDRLAVRREERDIVSRNGHVALVKEGTRVLQYVWERGMETLPFLGMAYGAETHARRFRPIMATPDKLAMFQAGMDWVLNGAKGVQPSFWPD